MSDKKKFWLGALAGAAGMVIIVSIIKSINNFICTLLVFCLIMGAQLSWYGFDGYGDDPSQEYYDDSQDDYSKTKSDEIMDLIRQYYLFDYDETKLEDAELSGLMKGLDDPFSEYYSYDDIAVEREEKQREYSGVGMQVIQDAKSLEIVVSKVFAESPARNAGVAAGDVLISVDGKNIEGQNINDVVELIKGEPGTEVTIGIRRADEEIEFSMPRSIVNNFDLSYKKLEDNTAYIEFTEFTEESVEEMKQALARADADEVMSLIIDLRNNPGGTLNSVCLISDFFLDIGDIILTTSNKDKVVTSYSSENEPLYFGDVIFLVNENTASAAEIFTAALREHDRACVVGTTTYGKGIVQSLHQLSDGTYIKLTTEYYYTPDGNCPQGVGIKPDVIVEPVPGDVDVQFEKALEIATEH